MYEPDETELVKKLVTKDMVCLDIGANVGYYTVLLSSLAEYVYAFEAEPRNAARLAANTKDLHNVDTRCVIVSDKDDWGNLYLCNVEGNGTNGMHRTYPSKWCSDVSISIPSIRIDSLITIAGFIKMDIEGAELDALHGMYKLLERFHPIILMEFHPPSIKEKHDNPEQIYHLLKTLGYTIYLIPDTDKPISYQDLYNETMKEPSGRNILCIH